MGMGMGPTKKEIKNAIIGIAAIGAIGGAALIGGIGGVIGLHYSKQEIEQAREQGRAQATSNLVSAVETMTRFSKDNLNYRALGAFDNPGLNDQQKMSYGEACFHGIRYLDRISELIQTDATKIASGEKTAEGSLKSFIEFESSLNRGDIKY
jgi:hypothetical protein